MISEKAAKVIEINDKKVFGTPQKLLDEYKIQAEEIMSTMTKEEIEELLEARPYPQQYKIYVKRKFIDRI